MQLSNLQIIMMNELKHRKSTGYDLTKVLHQKGWKASHQQLYRDLGKLQKSGLVSLKVIPQSGKPDKHLYQLTELGIKQLSQAYTAVPTVSRVQDEALVHLFLVNSSYFKSAAVVISEQLKSLCHQNENMDLISKLAVERNIERLKADLIWVNNVLAAITEEGNVKAA